MTGSLARAQAVEHYLGISSHFPRCLHVLRSEHAGSFCFLSYPYARFFCSTAPRLIAPLHPSHPFTSTLSTTHIFMNFTSHPRRIRARSTNKATTNPYQKKSSVLSSDRHTPKVLQFPFRLE